jgi:cytochrome c5
MSQSYGSKVTPEAKSNRAFFVRFGVVTFAIGVFAAVLMLLSRSIGAHEPDPQVMRDVVAQRIAPVGKVVTDPAALQVAAAQSKPDRAPLSGEQVVAQVCGACHNAGVLEAPKSHDTATWIAREKAAGGADALLLSAIKGKGAMPPRGGDPNLSDEEVRAAIEVMQKG